MRAQGAKPGQYAHPARTLAVIRPLEELQNAGLFDKAKSGLIKAYDGLINYMYLPAMPERDFPESVALLYMPVTLRRDEAPLSGCIATKRFGEQLRRAPFDR